ncbi:MAG: tetratricopeptide repeat protein [Candidatus Bathyarchaeia archaeon]|jgi:tetratricopeptide (TPR) repeat protein
MSIKEDPIKLHKDANALMENGKYVEARDLFTKVGELYYKGQNYFGSAEMYYKAGECSANLKEYQKAVEYFNKAADVALNKGFDRYGLSALEQARDNQKASGNTKEAEEIDVRIKEINDKLNKQNADADESSFSLFS